MIELNKNNKNLCGIYCITNTINNKVYIGSTNCFYPRKRQHFLELRGNYHRNPKLQNFVNKYGIETLQFNILEITKLEELKAKEQFYLDNISNKFNICVKADRPNVNRNFTKKDIKDIAELYNSGKCSTEISKIYFGKKSRQNYITSIIKGEIYTEYKYLFNEYKPKTNKSFSEDDVIKIAQLYNSGKTGCQISEIIYNNRNFRAKINKLVKGETYSEFSHLFNKRKYNQTGRKLYQKTKDKIGKANSGSSVLSISDIEFIKNNFTKISGRKIAKLLNKSKSTISYYIKNNLK